MQSTSQVPRTLEEKRIHFAVRAEVGSHLRRRMGGEADRMAPIGVHHPEVQVVSLLAGEEDLLAVGDGVRGHVVLRGVGQRLRDRSHPAS